MENSEANTGLIEHLKNEDFFNVKQFPNAKLVITKTQYHNNKELKIYAELTIKGITKPR
ncbi:YceI family protein, partial [Aurantibacter sp.]|uniref:YceI family protein n=1 Tax=Aurantibacter sp. TaxID=2807103 RepID=UPI0035C84EE3